MARAAERGMEKPPESGSLHFTVPLEPISVQASSARIRKAKKGIQSHLPSTQFLLSGDVSIEIEWWIHEADRYESAAAVDVDNILKPLLDVLCGPGALLIDDNQVQSVRCSWIDWTSHGQAVDLQIRFRTDEFVQKDELVFVEIEKSLCMPINRGLPPKFLTVLLDAFQWQFDQRRLWQGRGYDYYQSKGFMSIQRVFHTSRLQQFEVLSLAAMRREIARRSAASGT